MKDTAKKVFVCFLCFSFFLVTSGTSRLAAQSRERNIPIGEMISKGAVLFEARANAWKSVDPSHFPVFRGVKIKTDKGVSAIALESKSQIDVKQESMLTFTQDDQLALFQGGIDFRVPPTAQMSFRVGSLFIIKSHVLQAARNSGVAAPKSEEMIGTLSLHSNGALTVKSVQGELSVLDQDHILLASLPPNQSITIPSAVVSGKQRVMVAQVGVVEGGDQKSGGMNDGGRGRAGLPILIGNAAAILLNAGVAGYIVGSALVDDDSDDDRPLCR